MFGSFLVPSSTVVADESQERTKTSLANLLESPKETTWCQDDKNMTKPALDIFGWTWFTRWRSKVQMYGSALLLLCLCIVRPYLCTTEDWKVGILEGWPRTKTRQPSLICSNSKVERELCLENPTHQPPRKTLICGTFNLNKRNYCFSSCRAKCGLHTSLPDGGILRWSKKISLED